MKINGSDKPLRLGEFELETLEHLWTRGEGSAKSIHAELGARRGNSLNTVQSTLDRLYRKGLLARVKTGHSFKYRCRCSREEVLARKFNDLAAELSGGEVKSVLAAFVEFTSRLEESRIEELEALIEEHKKNRGAGS